MKNIIALSLLSVGFFFMQSFEQNASNDNSTQSQQDMYASLDTNEIELLKHMREEEKLARDVYTYLYNKYDFFVFNNISQSEQRHMDRMLTFLNLNNIPDPASTEIGVFNNPELQKLYNQLIKQGDISLTEALKVGATIEDLDIKDLMEFSKSVKNPALLSAFENLTCGSRNHMRAFVSQLELKEVKYTPQFISAEEFKVVVDGDHERCGQNSKQGNFGNQKSGNKNTGKGKGKNRNAGNCINK